MRNPKTNRMPIAICIILAAAVLWATGLLMVRLKPYWVARFRGHTADLHGARLSFAPLAGADLEQADLTGADFTGANLAKANLIGAQLTGAHLDLANLAGAQLHGDLENVHLEDANLRGTDLTGVELNSACLRGADLTGAKLLSTLLFGADMRAASLRGADLTDAIYDAHTRWPAGFDPKKHGAVLNGFPSPFPAWMIPSTYQARDDDPRLTPIAATATPAIAALSRYHRKHSTFPAAVHQLAPYFPSASAASRAIVQPPPNQSEFGLVCGWSYQQSDDGTGYKLVRTVGFEANLYYEYQGTKGHWVFEPCDGSPEKTIILKPRNRLSTRFPRRNTARKPGWASY